MLMDLGAARRTGGGQEVVVSPEVQAERTAQVELARSLAPSRQEAQAEFSSREAVRGCRERLIGVQGASFGTYTQASIAATEACMRANEANIRATEWGNTYYDKNVPPTPTDETLSQAFSRIPKVVLFGGAGLVALIAYVKFFKG